MRAAEGAREAVFTRANRATAGAGFPYLAINPPLRARDQA
jgi:hypothetical protein